MTVLVITISITVFSVVLLIGETRSQRAGRTNRQGELPSRHTFKSSRASLCSMAWLISLTVLCFSIIAYSWLYPRALFLTIVPASAFITPAYLQGYNVSCGVLIWVVFRSTIGRNQGAAKSVISLLAISGGVLATVFISNREGSVAVGEIQRHVSSLASAGNAENSNVPRARGEFGEIEYFFKTRLSQMAALNKDYERELAAIGWETIFEPESLGRDPSLIMSNSIVEEAKQLVTKYKSETYDLCEDSKQAIAGIPISEWAKQHMVNSLRQVLEEVHAGLDERWSWEAQIIAVVEQVIAWLSSRQDAWGVEDGVLVFANESDLGQFNSYLTKLDKLTSQQGGREKESSGLKTGLNRQLYYKLD
jgi:hypothetical protein